METPIIIAVIAAATSILGALLAWSSAKRARQSAERVNSVTLRVTALDRESDELREAFKKCAEALGVINEPQSAVTLAASIEVLRACRGTDERLDAAAEAFSFAVSESTATRQVARGLGVALDDVRSAYRHCQARIEEQREDFFTRDLSDLDGWGVRMLNRLAR